MALPAEAAAADLTTLVRSSQWMMRVLAAVREADLPSAWVGAGVLRDLVWGTRYGAGFEPAEVRDVDVVYFDAEHLDRRYDDEATARLHQRWAEVPWEARNQAAVHTWYVAKFGGDPVQPLTSIREAVTTWPETATAVAVRLGAHAAIEVCAPLGLADLLGGVWRRNPRRVSITLSLARLDRHRPTQRWPGVRIVRPA
jgi:hypothetical protein